MPLKPFRPCSVPGCRALTRERYCAEHAASEPRRYEQARGSASRRGYDKAWRQARRRVLRRDPFCRWPGCDQPSAEVDHVVPLAAGGGDDESNLQGLCKEHHSRKTATMDGGYGRARARVGGGG